MANTYSPYNGEEEVNHRDPKEILGEIETEKKKLLLLEDLPEKLASIWFVVNCFFVVSTHEVEKKVHEKAILEVGHGKRYRVNIKFRDEKVYLGNMDNERRQGFGGQAIRPFTPLERFSSLMGRGFCLSHTSFGSALLDILTTRFGF